MVKTAATASEVYSFILQDRFYDDILKKFISDKANRNELKQELWVYLCSMDEEKITKSWNERWFQYLFISIVKNQVKSSNSRFHRMFRNNNREIFETDTEVHNSREDEIIEFECEDEKQKKLRIINESLNSILTRNPMFFCEIELFRMHYFQNLSYRKISEKTKIPLTSVHDYVNTAKTLLKGHIKKYYN